MKKILVCLMALTLIATNLYATGETAGNKEIDKIVIYTAPMNVDVVLVYFTPSHTPVETSNQCGGEDYIFRLEMDSDTDRNYETIYSALLTAASSGKKVDFGINGCNGDNPLIYRVSVHF